MTYAATQDVNDLINNRLRLTRQKNNHSQSFVSKFIGLSGQTIVNIERGYSKRLYESTIQKLNKYFEIYGDVSNKEIPQGKQRFGKITKKTKTNESVAESHKHTVILKENTVKKEINLQVDNLSITITIN